MLLWLPDDLKMKIVLASESAFRKRALDLLGVAYETCPAALDEKTIRDPDPFALTRKLAEAKACKVAEQFPDALIISGDAVAAKDGRIFEKPRDNREAAEFLWELSGSEFQFVTSLAVLNSRTRRILSAAEASNITFRPLIEREIQDYISRHPVLNFAGAFESDAVLRFADKISGSYNFVAALPVSLLVVFLRAQDVEI